MKRLIPSQIKEEKKIIKGLSGKDLLIIIIGVALVTLIMSTSFSGPLKLTILIMTVILFAVFLMRIDTVQGYKLIGYWFKYFPRKKNFENISYNDLGITFLDDVVKMNDSYTSLIELNGIDFGILKESDQNDVINSFSNIIKELKNGKIIKLEKPLDLQKYVTNNEKLIEYYDSLEQGDNIGIQNKLNILINQNTLLDVINTVDRRFVESFCFVVCEKSENFCRSQANQIKDMFVSIGLLPVVLSGENLKNIASSFFKGIYNTVSLDEKSDKFQQPKVILEENALPENAATGEKLEENALPENVSTKESIEENTETACKIIEESKYCIQSIKERKTKIYINSNEYRIVCLGKYPYYVNNAWGHDMFNIEDTFVTFNFSFYDKKDIEKIISKSITELKTRMNDPKIREDQRMEYSTNYQSLDNLLFDIVTTRTESLYNTECYFMYPKKKHKDVWKIIRGKGIKINDMFCTQHDAWLSMCPFLSMPSKISKERVSPMQSSSIAAMFPFVSKQLFDPNGWYLGYTNRHPIFWDPFYLSGLRVNGNMVIFGKSGGGKTYFAKKHVMYAATANHTVIILDPDDEYKPVCKNMNGNWVDAAGERFGRINPLQVFPSLKEEGGIRVKNMGDVSSHRQFLAGFFNVVCPNMSENCILYLNKIIGELYKQFKIFDDTDVMLLKVEEFPIFDDLLKLVNITLEREEKNGATEEVSILKRVSMYIEQFANEGIYARLWNGYTTIKIENKFNVYNFQSLFKNNNKIVANGQMLLLMSFFNQEIIKNRELNKSRTVANKIMIVVDEAHRFINAQFPVALDFMSTMAKQIRKYDGSLVVATQNIDDFVGVSLELKAQASAIINACQYSMIFGLFADDINKIKELYQGYNGGLNDMEIDYIVKARQGDALFIVDTNTRLPIHIDVFDTEDKYFLEQKVKQN